MADLSIIIVSHNSREWLSACLESVYAHAGAIELEVIVVDNGSSDSSAEFVEAEFPRARVLRSENRGFAYANNRGLDAACAPFVLFLNPDTEIETGNLEDVVRALESQPETGLIGCRQLNAEGELFATMRRFPSVTRQAGEALGSEHWPVRFKSVGERVLDEAMYEIPNQCDWVSGSFMLGRTDAIREAGAMDERYFLYCEEPDLCLRLRRNGWRVGYTPTMTITHYFWKNALNTRLIAQETYARLQYLAKNQGLVRGTLSSAFLLLFHLRRVLNFCGRTEADSGRRAASLAALLTIVGIHGPPFGELSGPRRGARMSWPADRDDAALTTPDPDAV